jgi:seryl-tRNA synthetase
MTTSTSPAAASPSSSNGVSGSSLPRWRWCLSMLNWRRDPDYERRMNALAIRIQQTRNETEQIKKDTEQIKKDTEQIKKDTEQIKNETEQLRQETERLRRQNAKGRQLLSQIDALCFPDASSSTLPPSIVNDSASSSI